MSPLIIFLFFAVILYNGYFIFFSKEDSVKKRNTIIPTLLLIALGISVYFYKKGSLERINAAIEKAENKINK